MGLSTTAAYGILFTASLIMFATVLSSIIYSYTITNQGMENRSTLMESAKNVIEMDRVVYNSSKIEIYAINRGPLTLNTSDMSIIVNGTMMNFTFNSPYWFPGNLENFDISTNYTLGTSHEVQFKIDVGDHVIATAERDKIYVLNETSITAYSFLGVRVWSVNIQSPLDVACGSYLYVLNSTEIEMYDFSGNYIKSFAANLSIIAITATENYVYGISNDTLYIFDSTGNLESEVALVNARDVTVGKYLYVLEGNEIYEYTYDGYYITRFTDWRITNATKIGADEHMQGSYIFVLNNHNEILIYENGTFAGEIPLTSLAENIDIYGKIYISAQGVLGMNMGYRVKIVDEYGNEVYGYL
ncbi:putative archaeal flagellar protein F [Aciduliprofundum sp. MAR08-339]|uniref:flagellar protein F n=1 Tax=Aciduliprofundum sp. (strain MAR08-339) TaxID=673860 RepID=UPI0002A4AAD8|nr:putative archaeal flagellar protein F [Aciduliprofundum sp. MAR08-339]